MQSLRHGKQPWDGEIPSPSMSRGWHLFLPARMCVNTHPQDDLTHSWYTVHSPPSILSIAIPHSAGLISEPNRVFHQKQFLSQSKNFLEIPTIWGYCLSRVLGSAYEVGASFMNPRRGWGTQWCSGHLALALVLRLACKVGAESVSPEGGGSGRA